MTQARGRISLEHLKTMTGSLGLYQHATFREPLLSAGYCVDDNARAISTLLRLTPYLTTKQQTISDAAIDLAWQFITDARREPTVYYNFRRVDGSWITTPESQDMYARLIRACADTLHLDQNTSRQQLAAEVLAPLLDRALKFTALRAVAEIALALRELPLPLRQHSKKILLAAWDKHAAPAWAWFEPMMTYANALLPHGILALARYDSDPRLQDALTRSTDFLMTATIENDTFLPIGNRGWYRPNAAPSRDGQQPIEAGTMFDFLIDYHHEIKKLPAALLTAPYQWLYGKNSHHFPLVDAQQGACRDGLDSKGPNENCGAESLLVYLFAEARLHDLPVSLQQKIEKSRAELGLRPALDRDRRVDSLEHTS